MINIRSIIRNNMADKPMPEERKPYVKAISKLSTKVMRLDEMSDALDEQIRLEQQKETGPELT